MTNVSLLEKLSCDMTFSFAYADPEKILSKIIFERQFGSHSSDVREFLKGIAGSKWLMLNVYFSLAVPFDSASNTSSFIIS